MGSQERINTDILLNVFDHVNNLISSEISTTGIPSGISTGIQIDPAAYKAVKDLGKHPRRIKIGDYAILQPLGKGGYGEVYLVRDKTTSCKYTMKRIPKEALLKQPYPTSFRIEKECMDHETKYLTRYRSTFQDAMYIYFIMDFYPGGDLLNLVITRKLNEKEIRFLAAEMVLCLEEIHSLGFIHRDIKPDNFLLTFKGHLKLTDFGSAIKMCPDGSARSDIPIGACDYIAPEMLKNSPNGFTGAVDFWGLGVVIYELIFNTTPFYSENLTQTYNKISLGRFDLPNPISDELKSLLNQLICGSERRLDVNGIKNHQFFKDIDFNNLHEEESPIKLNLTDPFSTRYFQNLQFSPEEVSVIEPNPIFIGFTSDSKFHSYFQNESFSSDISEFKVHNVSAELIEKPFSEGCNLGIKESIMSLISTICIINDDMENIKTNTLRDNYTRIDINDAVLKELRIKKNEVKNLQLKLNNEISIRSVMEEEINILRRFKTERGDIKAIPERDFSVRLLREGGKWSKVSLTVNQSQCRLIIDNIRYNYDSVFMKGLKRGDLYNLEGKTRNLVLKIYILNESTKGTNCSSASSIPKERLEKEIETEHKMIEGIKNLILASEGAVEKNARKQLEGSKNKIKQLKSALLEADSLGGTHDFSPEDEKAYGFNHHMFLQQPTKSVSFCYHCNELCPISPDQNLSCKYCGMIVHKLCYVLVDISCELYTRLCEAEICFIKVRTPEERVGMLKMVQEF